MVSALSAPHSLESAFIQAMALSPWTFNTTIDPADEMFLYGRQFAPDLNTARIQYFRTGAELLGTIRQIAQWKFGGLANVPCFLEFACGYGRLTRFLVQEIPPERMWVSDIYSGAVAFQRGQFFVNGFDSVTEPEGLSCEQRFDLIFVVSLFTHLPERRFEQWLAKLYSLLTPRGLLAFSVHAEHLAGGVPIPPSGLLFKPTSESGSLDVEEYGVSYVTEAFVREMLRRTTGVNGSYLRIPSALCRAQDLYLVSRNPQEDYSTCRYRQDSIGYVDSVRHTAANQAHATGWAADPNEGKQVLRMQVNSNGRLLGYCPVNRLRPDVAKAMKTTKYERSGWECLFPLENVSCDGPAALEFWAISSDGTRTLLDVRCPVPS